MIAVLIAIACSTGAMAQKSWSFAAFSANDVTNLGADATNWEHESSSSNDRYKNKTTFTNSPLIANGAELETTAGLNFTAPTADAIRCDIKGKRIALNKANAVIIIPNLTAGTSVTVKCKTSSKDTARGLNVTNLTPVSGSFNATSLDDQTNVGTVTADGDVTIAATGGMYVYSVEISAEGETPTPDVPVIGGTTLNLGVNQMNVLLKSGEMKYFNTSDVANVEFSGNKMTINSLASGAEPVVYDGIVSSVSFRKAEGGSGPAIDNPEGKVALKEAKGWNEAAYVKWLPYTGADTYKVYVKAESASDWKVLDDQLIRNYGSYGRADAMGLAAGYYAMKVVPVVSGTEVNDAANEISGLEVTAFDRAGFAHKNFNGGVGAYNNDGTLKSGAQVLYVTNDNFNTISMVLPSNNKGGTETYTGLGEIFKAHQKGYCTTPIAVRIIGQIDVDKIGTDQLYTDQKGLLLKGNNADMNFQITLEGVGDDASFKGFGAGFVNGSGIEMRNLGVMLHGSSNDCVEVKGSHHIWIHNCDLFYGQKGGGDHDKGDGSMDCKDGCSYATFSYNHFFDCGKSILCGMKSETVENLITYHHNWFDHSDSRHPRVRTSTVHIYNNYYDGCSKYGVGATTGCSLFVESNYFRGTKRPMMSSKQGTDATGDGTFSGENGGIIKSFGNLMVERSSKFSYITYQTNATSFDAYEASTRDEVVPSSVVTLAGGTSYSNFDTNASTMYDYTADDAADVPAKVMGYRGAGRMNQGDIHYTFNNSVDDEDYGRNSGLDQLLSSYKCSLAGFFGQTTGGSTTGGGSTEPDPVDPDPVEPVDPVEGTIICEFTGNQPSSPLVTVSGNYSTSKGVATYGGNTYSTCVKLESATSISVAAGEKEVKMTLVFADTETTPNAKINGTKVTGANSMITQNVSGTVTITKASTFNLFLIVLEQL